MITLYEMKENKLNSPIKIRYCLYDEITGYRSLVVSKIADLASEGNTLLVDDTNSFMRWQVSNDVTLTPLAKVPSIFEMLSEAHPEILL